MRRIPISIWRGYCTGFSEYSTESIHQLDSASNNTTELWCYLTGFYITSKVNCVSIFRMKSRHVFRELFWDSAQNYWLRIHTELHSMKALAQVWEALEMRGSLPGFLLSPCLPRDSTTLTWLYHFSSREDLAVHFTGYHLHSTLCTNATCPGLSAAALHQEKRRHSLVSKGHENCLGSAAKKVREVLGGRKNFLL